MKAIVTVLALLISSLVLFSCKKDDNPIPPEDQPQASLTLEDVSCTEAWVNLNTSNLTFPADVDLYKDSVLVDIINLTIEDTILYVDSLLPNKTYTFTSRVTGVSEPVTSNQLPVTTIDTTSHNFTWQTWTFGGQAGSCVLYDAAIINENDIWAVGEIYLLDTLGQPDPQAYGMAIWDGQNWELKKLFYDNNIPVTPRGIWVINPNDIYLASGSIFHWDGTSPTVQLVYSRLNLPNPNATIEKLWGTPEILYGVGTEGTIVAYQNGQWRRIESGTDVNIDDIYSNKKTNLVYCAIHKDLITIDNNFNTSLIELPPDIYATSIWFENQRHKYTCGGGIYEEINNSWLPVEMFLNKSIGKIKGTDHNNIFAVGTLGMITNYNGYTWSLHIDPLQGIYFRLDVTDNLVTAVGFSGAKALITLGKRN